MQAAARLDVATRERGELFAIEDQPVALEVGQQDRVVALIDHGVAAPGRVIALPVRVEEVDDASLGVHHVVIQILFKPLP